MKRQIDQQVTNIINAESDELLDMGFKNPTSEGIHRTIALELQRRIGGAQVSILRQQTDLLSKQTSYVEQQSKESTRQTQIMRSQNDLLAKQIWIAIIVPSVLAFLNIAIELYKLIHGSN